jgi:hypothetical protein
MLILKPVMEKNRLKLLMKMLPKSKKRPLTKLISKNSQKFRDQLGFQELLSIFLSHSLELIFLHL